MSIVLATTSEKRSRIWMQSMGINVALREHPVLGFQLDIGNPLTFEWSPCWAGLGLLPAVKKVP